MRVSANVLATFVARVFGMFLRVLFQRVYVRGTISLWLASEQQRREYPCAERDLSKPSYLVPVWFIPVFVCRGRYLLHPSDGHEVCIQQRSPENKLQQILSVLVSV